MERKPYFDRDMTAKIKGIALTLMFIHHFFTFPQWIQTGESYPALIKLAPYLNEPTRICVGLFAFLNGYLAAFQTRRGFKEGVRKLTDFLCSYWAVYLVLLLFARFTHKAVLDPVQILYEMFAIKHPIMQFCWYVPFYLVSYIVMYPVQKLAGKGLWGMILGLVLPPVVFSWLSYLCKCYWGVELWASLIELCDCLTEYFPVTAMGLLFARYDLFSRFFDKILGRGKTGGALCALLALLCMVGRYYAPYLTLVNTMLRMIRERALFIRISLDIIYAPVLVYCLVRFFRAIERLTGDEDKKKGKRVGKSKSLAALIGRYSMFMWFWHCVFFNACREYTQPVLYAPKFPPLVLLWGLVLCLAASWFIDFPVKKGLALKNALLFTPEHPAAGKGQ